MNNNNYNLNNNSNYDTSYNDYGSAYDDNNNDQGKNWIMILTIIFAILLIIILIIFIGSKFKRNDNNNNIVAVTDTVSPVVTLNGEALITINVGDTYNDSGAYAYDTTDGQISSKIVVTNPVDTSKAGTYTITYKVTDKAGNIGVATRIVIVKETTTDGNNNSSNSSNNNDNSSSNNNNSNSNSNNNNNNNNTNNNNDTTRPTITLNGNSTISLTVGQSYVEYGAYANDNKDGNITSSIVITGNVDTNRSGTYTRTYTVSDKAGNKASVNRAINVVSRTAPSITLNGNQYVVLGQYDTYVEYGATATDSVEGNISSRINITKTNMDSGGYVYITYSITNNAGLKSQTVRLVKYYVASASTSRTVSNESVPSCVGKGSSCAYDDGLWKGTLSCMQNSSIDSSKPLIDTKKITNHVYTKYTCSSGKYVQQWGTTPMGNTSGSYCLLRTYGLYTPSTLMYMNGVGGTENNCNIAGNQTLLNNLFGTFSMSGYQSATGSSSTSYTNCKTLEDNSSKGDTSASCTNGTSIYAKTKAYILECSATLYPKSSTAVCSGTLTRK